MEFPFLVALARMGCNGALVTAWMTHPQFYPTLFCATSLAMSNFFARTFVILAPFVSEIAYPTPFIIYTVLAVV